MSVFNKVYEKMYEEIIEKNEYQNKTTSEFLRTIFYSTVISSFDYEGDIPDFIKDLPDYIEETFFMSPILAYFKEGNERYITPAYPNGVLQKNGLYSSYTCIFRNGEVRVKDAKDVVLGFNNSLGLPNKYIVDEILEKCVNALRSVDMSLERASTPELTFAKNQNSYNALTNAIKDAFDRKTPYALINASTWGEEDMITTKSIFDNRAQDILALWDVFVRYKNLFFTTFGVNNVEISKTERLTRAEGESNTEMTRYGLFYDEYMHRKDWFKRIEEYDGSKINTIINRNFETVSALTLTNEEKKKMQEMVIAPYANEDVNITEDNKEVEEVKEDEAE